MYVSLCMRLSVSLCLSHFLSFSTFAVALRCCADVCWRCSAAVVLQARYCGLKSALSSSVLTVKVTQRNVGDFLLEGNIPTHFLNFRPLLLYSEAIVLAGIYDGTTFAPAFELWS